MSDTMKAALDAALRYHIADETLSHHMVLDTAKLFYRELAVAAPSGVDAYDEDWCDQVSTWLRVLNGDQLGFVSTAVQRISAERNPPVPLLAPPASAPQRLLDQLNGPQPYPGTAAPVGPLVTHDELEARLAELGGDKRNAGDVAEAAHRAHVALEPGAISEALGRKSNESLLAAAERVMKELTEWHYRAERAEATLRNATFALPDSERARPAEGPALVAGDAIRIRERGADVFLSTTVSTVLEYSSTEGFVAFVPQGAFAEGRRDEIGTESINQILKLLAPARLSGTIAQQIKELVGTHGNQILRIRRLKQEHGEFEKKLREIVGALPESESDDHYHPEQPTLDAVERVVRELVQRAQRPDGSRYSRDELLSDVQQGWTYGGRVELQA